MARLSHFSNQRSALEYFAGCLFHEQILFFRFQKKAWHKTVSSSLQHLWVVQQLSHKFYSFNTFLFQSTATFSLISVLSLSLYLSSKFFSMALHLYAFCSFTNIFHTALERAVFSSSIMTICSLPFSLSDAFLLHGHFLLYSALLHPDCAFRIQMDLPCSTLSFLVVFPGCSQFSTLGDLIQWFTSHTYCPALLLIMPH